MNNQEIVTEGWVLREKAAVKLMDLAMKAFHKRHLVTLQVGEKMLLSTVVSKLEQESILAWDDYLNGYKQYFEVYLREGEYAQLRDAQIQQLAESVFATFKGEARVNDFRRYLIELFRFPTNEPPSYAPSPMPE